MAPNPPPGSPLRLPNELTIYTVGELHPQWLAWLSAAGHGDTPATLQAEAVDQVDAAGVQLLLALQQALAERGRALRLQQASTPLREACSALGLQQWLARHGGEGTPVEEALA